VRPGETMARTLLVAVCAVLLVVLLSVGGCCNTATPGEAFDRVSAMAYSRDARTGLCFAVFCWHDETRSVSYVPCTPEVLAHIVAVPQ